jgi:hypothetical protein
MNPIEGGKEDNQYRKYNSIRNGTASGGKGIGRRSLFSLSSYLKPVPPQPPPQLLEMETATVFHIFSVSYSLKSVEQVHFRISTLLVRGGGGWTQIKRQQKSLLCQHSVTYSHK